MRSTSERQAAGSRLGKAARWGRDKEALQELEARRIHILKRHEEGWSGQQIADEIGISRVAVCLNLQKMGIHVAADMRREAARRTEVVRDLTTEGVSPVEIAGRLGVSTAAVHWHMKRAGLATWWFGGSRVTQAVPAELMVEPPRLLPAVEAVLLGTLAGDGSIDAYPVACQPGIRGLVG